MRIFQHIFYSKGGTFHHQCCFSQQNLCVFLFSSFRLSLRSFVGAQYMMKCDVNEKLSHINWIERRKKKWKNKSDLKRHFRNVCISYTLYVYVLGSGGFSVFNLLNLWNWHLTENVVSGMRIWNCSPVCVHVR